MPSITNALIKLLELAYEKLGDSIFETLKDFEPFSVWLSKQNKLVEHHYHYHYTPYVVPYTPVAVPAPVTSDDYTYPTITISDSSNNITVCGKNTDWATAKSYYVNQ